MSEFNAGQIAEILFGAGPANLSAKDFTAQLIECVPSIHYADERIGNFREFLERLLLPNGEELARVHSVLDSLYQYVDPETAPSNWVEWMLGEWWGWWLVPAGYPLARKRRLLKNLHRHYTRRYTRAGVRELLKEFSVIAEVHDKPCAVGRPPSRGSRWPLQARIYVKGVEPFFTPRRSGVGHALGHVIAHTTQQIITHEFVMELARWSRPAGCRFLVEWHQPAFKEVATAHIQDDDEITLD